MWTRSMKGKDMLHASDSTMKNSISETGLSLYEVSKVLSLHVAKQ
jgi:hypothetical protein